MTTTVHAPATPTAPAPALPLDFDARLALAALAVDARINTEPLNLADVITVPAEAPSLPVAAPVLTPLADCLRRAHRILTNQGWTRGALRDQGKVCAGGAIQAAATSRGQADDACALLLDIIRREFPHADTVPSWNDQQPGAGPVLRMLDQAANHAAARGI